MFPTLTIQRKVRLRCVAKLGDFGLPIDFGPRLPIPWLPPEIVCSVDRTTRRHRPESDVWMFGVLAWECATLGAEPHYQRNFEEIQYCYTLEDRGLSCPLGCPVEYWSLIQDCLADQHRRPRFAGDTDSPSSAIFRLRELQAQFVPSFNRFHMVANVSNCTCVQHRCNVPIPPFSGR
jgi:hypothetical protein